MKKTLLITSFGVLLFLAIQQISFSQEVVCPAMDESKMIKVNVSTEDELPPVHLSLCEALQRAKKNNLNIAIKQGEVSESELKIDEVKSKRLFLFFKFANASALEKSAQYGYEAEKASLDTTVHKVLVETTKKYYTLLQSIMARQVAEEFLNLGKLSLNESEQLLNAGEATKFEVKQTEVFVENLKQKLLEAEIAYLMASVDLAQYVNEKDINIKIIPNECIPETLSDNNLPVQVLHIVPENILLGDSIKYALQHRPELKEISYKIKVLEELIKATRMEEIKVKTLEAQISQLNNALKMSKNGVKATVSRAILQYIGSKNQIEVAKEKFLLSQKAYEQAKITRKEGFATNKDVLDAQVNLAKAKNDYIEAVLKFNISQVELTKELGLISIDIINENKPIEISDYEDNLDQNDLNSQSTEELKQ